MSGFLERQLGRRTAPAWWIAAVGATAVGATLSATAPQLPGTEVLSIEDGVDAVGLLALGGLGVILIRRGVATGLGRALLLMSEVAGIVWLGSGLADALAGGETPPAMVRLLALGAEVLHIAVPVLLLVAPLLLFPTGRLPSSRWRWAVVSAATGVSLAMASMLLAPGYVDDDVHAWGTNPMGVKALDGLTGVVEAAGAVLVLASVLMAAAAVVVRLVRYRGARRRQMWWFLGGIAALVLGVVSDPGSSAVAQTAWALVIFATLLGGMAWALLGPPAHAVHDDETETLRTSRPTGFPAPSATDT